MTALISIEHFGYAYPPPTPEHDKRWVLSDVTLNIQEGEFLSIMGPVGVGKTTLCLALNGIVPQSTGGSIRGDILIDGKNTKRTKVPELAHEVGLVFQEPETQLFNMSVESEIAFGLEGLGLPHEEIEERIEWVLSVVGMREFRHRSPFQLSGGQKQRTAIAAVLAMMPRILVLDEPTANLDPLGKTEVFSVVRQLRQQRGMTIIMVEHESERIAEFSDRVVVLNEGTVALEGTPREVFSQVDTMREIGLSVPQVSELGDCLNHKLDTDYVFTNLEEAYRILTGAAGESQPS